MPDARELLEEAVETVADQASELADLVRTKAEDALGEVQTTFIDNPVGAIVGALAVGFVLAVLVTRPKTKIIYVRETPPPIR